MESANLITNASNIVRQRNLFLFLTIGLVLAVLCLSLRILTFNQKVVLVPSINKEMIVTENSVSRSYLEEVSLFFLSNLLDISKGNIKYKKDIMLKYTHDEHSFSINDYFSKAEDSYKNFDLATYFTVKNLEIDSTNLIVIANGILTAWYGLNGHELKEVSYKMTFGYVGGLLRLKEFVKIDKGEVKS